MRTENVDVRRDQIQSSFERVDESEEETSTDMSARNFRVPNMKGETKEIWGSNQTEGLQKFFDGYVCVYAYLCCEERKTETDGMHLMQFYTKCIRERLQTVDSPSSSH